MYLWVSDYMFETIAYVAQKHNILVHNLTANDVSRYICYRCWCICGYQTICLKPLPMLHRNITS